MRAMLRVSILIFLTIAASPTQAQVQSATAADQTVSKNISQALVAAGIDPRTTSVKVITTSDHTVYLTGLISDQDTIKLAADVAAKTAPDYKIINRIHSSFFDDPNHVSGDKTK